MQYILIALLLLPLSSIYAQETSGTFIENSTPAQEKSSEDSNTLEETKKSDQDVLNKGKETFENIQNEIQDTRYFRSHYSHNLFINFSLIDTWLPFKWGGSYAYNSSASSTWELEYLKSSYAPFGVKELGEFTDQRISFFYRSFSQRNSFSFLYGLYYNSFNLSIGDKLLSNITGGVVPGYDLLTVETLGVS